MQKTEGIWQRNQQHHQNNCDILNINWPTTPFRSLGIYVGHNQNECYELNQERKLECIQKCAESWLNRKLTMIGKIYVIKSELISKLIFTATMIPIPNDIIKKFII